MRTPTISLYTSVYVPSLVCIVISVFENFLKVVDNLSFNLVVIEFGGFFFTFKVFSKCLISKFGLKNEVDNLY